MRERIVVTDEAQLQEILTEAMAAPRLAFDTETTALEVYGPEMELVAVVVCVSKERAYYLPVGHEAWPGLPYEPRNLDRNAVKRFCEQLGKHPQRLVMHNAVYDQLVMWVTMGVHPKDLPADDTAVMAHLMDENHPMNLKDLSRTYLGVQEEKAKLPDDIEEQLRERLFEEYVYEATTKNGRRYKKKGLRLKTDWLTRLRDYFIEQHDGAVSFDFVVGLIQKFMTVAKKAGIVEFTGQFPKNFKYVPIEIGSIYATDDVFNTLELYELMDRTFFDLNPKLRKLYEEIERPVQEVMCAATRKGLKVNAKHLEHVKKLIQERLKELHNAALEEAAKIIPKGDERFDLETLLDSHDQLRILLFEVVGYRPLKKTAKGKPSTAKDTLEKLIGTRPRRKDLQESAEKFLKLKMEYSALQKLGSTYTDSILSLLDGHDRLHAFFNIIGTVSGRMSSHNPNVQNIPRLTPEEVEEKPHLKGIDIRKAFEVDEGYVFVASDYDAMEMAGTAALSGDENLKAQLAAGRDLHSVLARRAFNVGHDLDDKTFKKVYPLERQNAKPVGFAIVYGGNEYTIRNRLGCDEETAQQLYNAYFEEYPGVKKWLDSVYAHLDVHKQIEYPIYGYIKRMDLPDPKLKESDPHAYDAQYKAAQRTCQNALIQGLCAFIVKESLVQIEKELRAAGLTEEDAMVIMQVHDEIICRAKIEHAKLVAEIMDRCMPREINGVKFTAKAEFKRTLSKADPALDIDELLAAA